MDSKEVNLKLPQKCLFFLNTKHRYKVAYGGRGSGKSYAMAFSGIIKAMEKKIRVLCTRQLQNSIKDSVHKLLCDCISALSLDGYFTITRDSIKCYNGSEFIFKGLQNNIQEIKSTEGIDICMVEEAQSVSEESWEILIPTIRKEGSEIWICFNPDRDTDPTYKKFVLEQPDDCLSVEVNYMDNPFFPEVLRKEMEYCKRVDYAKYEHIWLGKTIMETEAQIFKGKFEIKEFEAEPYTDFYYGADWGFACLVGDSKVKTNKGDVLLKDIKVGDLVLTRDGYKKVLETKKKGKKSVYAIDFGYKNSIIATKDHRIFTKDGWKRVDELKERETICLNRLSLMERFTNVIRKGNILTTFIINGKKMANTMKRYFIEKFGKVIMEKSQKVVLSIIKTITLLITPLKILFVLLLKNTQKFIIRTTLAQYLKKKLKIFGQKMDTQKKIGQKEEKSLWKQLKKGTGFVRSAVKSLFSQILTKSFVVQGVENIQIRVIAKKNTFAKRVVKNLWHRLMNIEKPVLKNVRISSRLLKEKQEVYDITVENGEFFANGVLVHNCDPTALTRSFIKDNCLYIEYEAGGVGIEMDELPQLFDSVPESRKWVIRADCARPETISYMARHGFRCQAAEKWKGSVEDGIEYLRSFEKIYIHPRCKRTYDEFKFYSYKTDKMTGDILPIIVDEWNHYIDSLRYALQPYIKGRGKMKISDNLDFEINSVDSWID